jgi:putative N6-adenine-specific DNA methylase
MAEKHRFKKEREFKQRLSEQVDNEEGDIRSFTFHHHDLKGEREEKRERRFVRKDDRDSSERFSRKDDRKGFGRKDNDRFDRKDDRKGFDRKGGKGDRRSDKPGPNRGGHERFDRSGGNKRNNKFNRHDYED